MVNLLYSVINHNRKEYAKEYIYSTILHLKVMVNIFQKVFDLLCSDVSEESLCMVA